MITYGCAGFEDICLKAKNSKEESKKLSYYRRLLRYTRVNYCREFATDYWVILESVRLKRLYDEVIEF